MLPKKNSIKKILLPITLFVCLFNLNAQEKSNIKLGIEGGFLPISKDTENLGLFLKVEPKIKVLENTFIGLRIGITINSHIFENDDNGQYLIDGRFDNGIFSFVPTIDYYFNENNLRPYIGVGLGYYLQPNPIEMYPTNLPSFPENIVEGRVNNRIGLLLRGGIESGKLRVGLEYSLVPKADIEIQMEQKVGRVTNSYLGLSIGVILGIKESLE